MTEKNIVYTLENSGAIGLKNVEIIHIESTGENGVSIVIEHKNGASSLLRTNGSKIDVVYLDWNDD